MECTEEVLRSLQLSRVFKPAAASATAAASTVSPHLSKLTSADFSDDGRYVVACDDRTVRLCDAADTGCHVRDVPCRKYGVGVVRFTHCSDHVLLTSKNGSMDDTIRYLSLTECRFLQYFPGHRDRVCSMEVHPSSDTFLSASVEGAVRLWDLRERYCHGMLQVKGRASVAFDPSGLVFAVTSAAPSGIAGGGYGGGTGLIRLFDVRNFDKGSFATFSRSPAPTPTTTTSPPPASATSSSPSVDIVSVSFSLDGKCLLCSTADNLAFVLDSFTGAQIQQYTDHENNNGSVLEPCFTPDGKHVISGSEDGLIYVWNTLSGKVVCVKKGHVGSVNVVRCNAVYLLLASCCYNLALWTLPSPPRPTT